MPRFLLNHLLEQIKHGHYKTDEATGYLEVRPEKSNAAVDETFYVRPDGSVIGYRPNVDGRGHTKLTFYPLKKGDAGKFVVESRWYRKPIYMVEASDNMQRLERPIYQRSDFEVYDAEGKASPFHLGGSTFEGGYQIAGLGHSLRIREEAQNKTHDDLAVNIRKIHDQAKPLVDDKYGQVRLFDTSSLFRRDQMDVLWDELNYLAQKIATGKKVFSILGDHPGIKGYDPDVRESLWEAFAPYLHWGMTEANRFYKARDAMAQGLLVPASAVLAINFRAGDELVEKPIQGSGHQVVQLGTLGGANAQYFPGMDPARAEAAQNTPEREGVETFPAGSTAFLLGNAIDELTSLTYRIAPSKDEHKKAITAIISYKKE